MLPHAVLLAAQAAFCGGVLLALFHQRRRVGLGPLYLVLGTLQFAQFVLAVSIRVQIAPGFLISPATAVLFPVTVMVVLLTYVVGAAEFVNVTISVATIYVMPGWVAVVSIVLLVRRPPHGFELEPLDR